jgi:hypothetical protein
MGFFFLLFGVVLSLCVVGLIAIALAAILGRVRDDWKLKKAKREIHSEDQRLSDNANAPNPPRPRVSRRVRGEKA